MKDSCLNRDTGKAQHGGKTGVQAAKRRAQRTKSRGRVAVVAICALLHKTKSHSDAEFPQGKRECSTMIMDNCASLSHIDDTITHTQVLSEPLYLIGTGGDTLEAEGMEVLRELLRIKGERLIGADIA